MKYPNSQVSIREVQLVQLEILNELDRICKKYNIKYELFGGTLLGAVRHKGFIPWDDDVDVCMLREDYDRFIEICLTELDNRYFLQTHNTDPKCLFQFAKIRKNGTVFICPLDSDPSTHTGIYIDVFPMDNVMPDTLIGKFQRICLSVVNAMITSRNPVSIRYSHNRIIRFCRILAYLMSKVIPKQLLDSLAQRLMTMLNSKETEYVNHLSNRASKIRYQRYLRTRESFNRTILLEFEGRLYPAPADFDSILKRLYGDYMSLPPVEKRKPHHGVVEVKI